MSRFAAIAAFLTVTAAYSSPALADFQRWSVGIEDDPFSGGKKVSVDYSETIRSGALIQCDTSQQGLRFRVVPGYVHTPVLEYATPTLEFAIDGKRLFAVKGTTGSVGDNLAIVRRQGFWDNRRRELTEALVHQVCHIRPLHLDEASGAV